MKESQAGNIQKYLEEGNSITSAEAYEKFGCTRLSGRIFELRKRGFNIITEMVEGRTRYGNYCQYARYTLIKK